MVLIFGGKYQGKVDYALGKYNLTEGDVFRCTDTDVDYSKKIIADLQEYIWQCTLKGIEAKEELDWERLEDKILICDDVSQGLVPMDKDEREFREMVGRTLTFGGRRAKEVIRVFCGLGNKVK